VFSPLTPAPFLLPPTYAKQIYSLFTNSFPDLRPLSPLFVAVSRPSSFRLVQVPGFVEPPPPLRMSLIGASWMCRSFLNTSARLSLGLSPFLMSRRRPILPSFALRGGAAAPRSSSRPRPLPSPFIWMSCRVLSEVHST